MTLTSIQKQNLKAQAHNLDPIIQIGKNGVTPQQLSQIRRALEDHELIKIKYLAHKNKKETLSKKIIKETDSEEISLIGNVLIIYKKNITREDDSK
jgi:RNA-binding protein